MRCSLAVPRSVLLDGCDAAALDRERRLSVLEGQRRLAEQHVAPALQGAHVDLVIGDEAIDGSDGW